MRWTAEESRSEMRLREEGAAHAGVQQVLACGNMQGVCRAVTFARVRDTPSHPPHTPGLGRCVVEPLGGEGAASPGPRPVGPVVGRK